jgi:TonB family protein
MLCSVGQVNTSNKNFSDAFHAPPAWAGLLLLFAQAGWAQSTPAAAPPPAAATSAPVAPNERAKRDADKVFQMILLHRDKKPAAKPAGKDGTAGAAPTVASPPAAPSRSTPAAAPAPLQAKPSPAASPTAPVVAAKPAPEATTVPIEAAVVPDPIAPPPVAAPADFKPALALPSPAPAAPIKLELLSSVEPEFPSRLVRTLGAGKVVVQFEVAADGTVTQAEAVQSSHRGLEAPAINAVKQWKFKPMAGAANGVTELKFE